MRLISCLHPKIVKNPYSGEQVTVRCGKCEACLNAKSANWVQRIKQEISDNKYTLFVTLQYDELHVPQMIRLRTEDDTNRPSFIDSLTGEIISIHDDSVPSRSKADYKYCFDTKVLLVHNNRDFPLFMKRLRYYFHELTKKSESVSRLRYYACAEYGPQTYRPHYHMLLFFNSSLFAQNYEELLNKSWKYGRVYDPHLVRGYAAANYVASYVNCVSHLPSIYFHKSIRPRTFFSKSPAIGTLSIGVEQVKEMFFSASPEQRLFDASCSQFRDVPLWRVFQNRLFPRIQRFNSLNHHDRVVLYRQVENVVFRTSSAHETAEWIEQYFIKRRNRKDFIAQYYRAITAVPTSLHCGNNVHYFKRYTFDSLVRFVRILNRVAVNASFLNVSIEDYVTQIEKFYENCEKSNYQKLLSSQATYLESHPKKDLILSDYAFLERVNGKDVSMLSDGDLFYLKYYGVIDDNYQGTISLHLEDSYEYQNLLLTHKKVFWDNTKSKDRNDYLMSKSNQFKNIITYKLSQNVKSKDF